MPRRRKRSSRQGRRIPPSRSFNSDTVVKFPFRVFLVTETDTASLIINSIDLIPSTFGGRVATCATLFEYFRFSKLRVSQVVSNQSVTANSSGTIFSTGITQYLAYQSEGMSDTTLSSQSALAALPMFKFGNSGQKIVMNVPKQTLYGLRPFKWWRTTSRDTPPYDETVQGCVLYSWDLDAAYSSGHGPYFTTLIEGVCEFTGRVLPGSQLHQPTVTVRQFPRNASLAPGAENDVISMDSDEEKADEKSFGPPVLKSAVKPPVSFVPF